MHVATVVRHGGRDYRVLDGRLDLGGVGLARIGDVKRLDHLEGLRILNVSHNRIETISGLEHLVDLRELYLNGNLITTLDGLDTLVNLEGLYVANNRITHISGLGNLGKLRYLYLRGNPIPDVEMAAAGGVNRAGHALDPQGFVRYCRDHEATMPVVAARKHVPPRDGEATGVLPEGKFTARMGSIMKVSESLTVEQLAAALGAEVPFVWQNVFNWAEQFGFTIKNGVVVFKKEKGVDQFIDRLDDQFADWTDKKEKI